MRQIRCFAAGLLLLFFMNLACVPATAASPTARALMLPVEIEADNADTGNAAALTDNSIYTFMRFDSGARLTVRCIRGLYGLSVRFYALPAPWTLEAGDTRRVCGEKGMLYAFETLPGSDVCTLTVPPGTVICEMTFYSRGTLPGDVQVWQPPDTTAELLLFPTHADDEQLFFGGLLPYYAAECGRSVQLAYLVNHAATEPYRVHELLNGLWMAGIRRYPVFANFSDVHVMDIETAAAIYNQDAVRSWQAAMIRRFRPLVVVGHDLGGEYGHGMHCLNAKMLTEAVPAAANPSFDPGSAALYGVHDTPKFYLHLYPQHEIRLRWDEIYLSAYNGQSALDVARAAYLCHVSQQQWEMSVEASGYGDCGRFGLYRSTVGDDVVRDDLFEHTELAAPPAEPSDTEPSDTEPADTEPADTEPADTEPIQEPLPAAQTQRQLPENRAWWGIVPAVIAAAVCGTVLIMRRRNRK